jgi:hypothetical protein
MVPSLTGRGWGWVGFLAAEAVSRFPGPPLEDPPTSPPRHSTGARGGSAVGRLAHGLPIPTGGAAARPMCQLAWRSGCSAADRTITSSGGSAADVPPSAANGAAVEPLRARHCTLSSAARLRAWRVTGVAFGTREHRAQRPASAARSPSGRRSCAAGRTKKPAIPGHGKGPQRVSAGSAGLTVLRQGWKPVRGETPVPRWLDAQRDSPTTRSGETPRPNETWQNQRHRTQHPDTQRRLHQQLKPGQQWTPPQHQTSDTTRPSQSPP